jgi:hypothetical protein
VFVLGALLGILHGHASYSLSVPCAHAFSMSPSYTKQYASSNGLVAPERDVRVCLEKKLKRCLRRGMPEPVDGRVVKGSAMNAADLLPMLKGAVDIVLTSPPYLAAQTYAKDNWLRLWFLGYDYKDIHPNYIETQSVETYCSQLTEAFRAIGRLMKPHGYLLCVAGNVRRRRKRAGLVTVDRVCTATLMAKVLASPEVGMELEGRIEERVPGIQRYFNALSASNGHTVHDLDETTLVVRKAV